MAASVNPFEWLTLVSSWLGRSAPSPTSLHQQALPTDLVLEAWATCRRDPSKRGHTAPQPWRGGEFSGMDCGEDAFLVTPNVLAVADGVGSWRKRGVDPSIFANRLLENAKGWINKQPNLDPVFLMQKAYSQICRNHEVKAGSSTAVFASLMDGSGSLRVANLGDSGLLLVREERCEFHMPETVWDFNTPYQLTAPPASAGRQPYGDQPEQSAVSTVQLQDGDVVVLGSDGLFDNLFPHEIAAWTLERGKGGGISPPPPLLGPWGRAEGRRHPIHGSRWMFPSPTAPAADLLLQRALIASQDRSRDTPFSQDALKYGLQYNGGKPDDITVIVARVRTRKDLEAHAAGSPP